MESTQVSPPRKLACRRCYRHKLRCIREEGNARCARCTRMDVYCEDRLEKSMGRPKGSRSVDHTTRAHQRKHSATVDNIQEVHTQPSRQRSSQKWNVQVLPAVNGSLLDVDYYQYTRCLYMPDLPKTETQTTLENTTVSISDIPTIATYNADPMGASQAVYSNPNLGLAYTDSSAVPSLISDDNASLWDFNGQDSLPAIGRSTNTPNLMTEMWPSQRVAYEARLTSLNESTFQNNSTPRIHRSPNVTTSIPETIKSESLEHLSDMQKFTTYALGYQRSSDPLQDLDMTGYPFTHAMDDDDLFSTPMHRTTYTKTRPSSPSGQSHMYHVTKRVFAAGNAFISTLNRLSEAWQYTNVRATTMAQHGPENVSYLTPNMDFQLPLGADSATNMLVLSCYERFLHLFTNIVHSMSNINRRSTSPYTRSPEQGIRLPQTANQKWSDNTNTKRTSIDNEQLLQLVSWLEKNIDESVRTYLSVSRTLREATSYGKSEIWQKPIHSLMGTGVDSEWFSGIDNSLQCILRDLSLTRRELQQAIMMCGSSIGVGIGLGINN